MKKKKGIEVVPKNGKWSVIRQNDATISTHNTKEKAKEKAEKIAKNEQTELTIKKKDGTIQNKNSYGKDPCPPKDKK